MHLRPNADTYMLIQIYITRVCIMHDTRIKNKNSYTGTGTGTGTGSIQATNLCCVVACHTYLLPKQWDQTGK